MSIPDLTDEVIAGILSMLGGLNRLVLNVDEGIPMYKQFILIFILSMPTGFLTYLFVVDIGYNIAAFFAGFGASLIALSLARVWIKHGAKTLFLMLIGRIK